MEQRAEGCEEIGGGESEEEGGGEVEEEGTDSVLFVEGGATAVERR